MKTFIATLLLAVPAFALSLPASADTVYSYPSEPLNKHDGDINVVGNSFTVWAYQSTCLSGGGGATVLCNWGPVGYSFNGVQWRTWVPLPAGTPFAVVGDVSSVRVYHGGVGQSLPGCDDTTASCGY
jgi:hypothetical protein